MVTPGMVMFVVWSICIFVAGFVVGRKLLEVVEREDEWNREQVRRRKSL